MARISNKAKFTVEVEYSGAVKKFEELFKTRKAVNNFTATQDSILTEKIKYERTEGSKLADQTKRIVSHVLKPAGFEIVTQQAIMDAMKPAGVDKPNMHGHRWKLPTKCAAISMSGGFYTSLGVRTSIEIRFGPADIRIIREPTKFLIKTANDPNDYWDWRNMDEGVISVELANPDSFQQIINIVDKFYEEKVVPFIDP